MIAPKTNAHFQGLRTIVYPVNDLERAKGWYASVLEAEPYFDQPFYVGFSVSGYELGLIPEEAGAKATEAGSVTYWGVPDVATARDRLLALGATARGEVQDVGDGISVAVVLDPFGNAFGVIQNPHFALPAA